MRRQVLGSTFWSVVGQGFSLAASLLSARLLIPHDRGLMASLILLLTIGGLAAGLGTNVAFRALHPRGKLSIARYRQLSRLLTLLEVPISVAAFLGVALITDSSILTMPVAISCVIFGASGFVGSQMLDALNGAGSFARSSIANTVGLVFTATALFVLLILPFQFGLAAALLTYASGNIARLAVCRHFLRTTPDIAPTAPVLHRETLRFAARFLPFSFGLILVYRVEVPLVAATIGAAASAMYSVAGTTVSLPQFFTTSIAQASLNHAAKGHLSRRALLKHVAMSLSATFAYSLVAVVVTPWAIPFLFGQEYADAVRLVPILCLSQLAMAVFLVASRVLAGLQRTGIVTTSILIGVPVLLTTSFAVATEFGFTSVAWVTFFVFSGLAVTSLLSALHLLSPSRVRKADE